MTVVRRLALAATAAGFATVLTLPAAVASAAPAMPAAAAVHHKPAKCPHGHPRHHYPPFNCKAKTNKSSVRRGGHITISGNGFRSHEQVSIRLHSTSVLLKTVRSTKRGNASATVTIPRRTKLGRHVLTMYGESSTNKLRATITVTRAAQAPALHSANRAFVNRSPTTGRPGSTLALELVGAGGGLAMAGFGLARARRRSTAR